MTVRVITEVVCDGCDTGRVRCPPSIKKQATKARGLAKVWGWKREIHGGKVTDLCPDCQENER